MCMTNFPSLLLYELRMHSNKKISDIIEFKLISIGIASLTNAAVLQDMHFSRFDSRQFCTEAKKKTMDITFFFLFFTKDVSSKVNEYYIEKISVALRSRAIKCQLFRFFMVHQKNHSFFETIYKYALRYAKNLDYRLFDKKLLSNKIK